MQISSFCVCVPNSVPLVLKQYRNDLPKDTTNVFIKRISDKQRASIPPMLEEGGLFFYHIRRHGVYYVAVTKQQVLPILIIELLTKVYSVCKDFCGSLTEDSIRLNVVLLYELLDEILDFGYIQLSSTERLKPFIQSEPVPVKSQENLTSGLFGAEHRIAPSDASSQPVVRPREVQEQRQNEVFVDIIERIAVLIDHKCEILRCEVNGCVNMKSFLLGAPEVKIGLNNDLVISKSPDEQPSYGGVGIQNCNFHECVDTQEVDTHKMLTIRPPQGEFTVMSYKLSGTLPKGLPIRVFSYIRQANRDIEFGLKLRCEMHSSHKAVQLTANVPIPGNTSSITQQLSSPSQKAWLDKAKRELIWDVGTLKGREEASAHFKLIGANEKQTEVDIGPVALDFEISGFVSSNLQIRFLRVFEREHSYVPMRWIRYITTPDSYIVKV